MFIRGNARFGNFFIYNQLIEISLTQKCFEDYEEKVCHSSAMKTNVQHNSVQFIKLSMVTCIVTVKNGPRKS